MALRFAEAIRRWVGWCPNAAMAGRRRYAVLEVEVETAKEGGREVVEGALVDYGPIGTPGRLFLLVLAGASIIWILLVRAPAALVTVPTFVIPPAGGLLLLAITLGYAALEFYGTVRRARIDIIRDAITISRPPFRPIVIPKGAIETVEVKENKLPVPSWFLAIALATLLASAAGSVYAGFGNPASMRFIFGLAAAVLFPVLFYRTYLRARYPQALAITTAKKRIAVIYTDDPERVARVTGVAG
ncbi:MAG: DUF1673 family protein [Methanomicrobiales archaeon]|nr:DUF1673 family protein [Methanomicrobiales archaeon]